MTIDEAIEHALWCARNSCGECSDEYLQLVDWLNELKLLRVESAKLRELARQMYPEAKAFLQLGVQLGCNDTLSYDWELQLHELGIEVS